MNEDPEFNSREKQKALKDIFLNYIQEIEKAYNSYPDMGSDFSHSEFCWLLKKLEMDVFQLWREEE